MKHLFYPERIAVFGVSPKPGNMATGIMGNLERFKFPGDVYAVGSSEVEVNGYKIYASVLDLPTDVDMAVFMIPARFIPKALEECAQKGVRRAVISTAGFGEYSEGGEEVERELQVIAEQHGIRFLGPNCLGITNLDNGMVLPFPPQNPATLLKGGSSIIAQSGGVSLRCAALFSESGVGFNKVISVGNKTNIDEVDLLEYLAEDPATDAIFMYLEDIKRGRRLMEVARGCSKPVVVMKSNISDFSAAAAKSHTAALASDDRVVDAALRQAGILRVNTLESFVTCAKAFALPKSDGDNIAVTTSSGGFAVIVSDIAGAQGFQMPPLSAKLVSHLEERSRGGIIKIMNPIDFGDVYDRSAAAYIVRELLQTRDFSAMAVTINTRGGSAGMGFADDAARELVLDVKDASLSTGKPVAITVFAPEQQLHAMIKEVEFPLFRTLEEAVQALAIQREYWRNRQAVGL